jgi:sorting nexin-1/2
MIEESASSPKQQTTAPAAASTSSRAKGKRVPKRFVTQPTRLEAVDDTLGPLGPLGAAPTDDASPGLPTDNVLSTAAHSTPSASQGSLSGAMQSVNLGDDEHDEDGPIRPRVPPPVQPPQHEGAQRQTQPSVSVVEAAKPSFQITVGDPHKVGDLTSAHTEYLVTTKVRNIQFALRLGRANEVL